MDCNKTKDFYATWKKMCDVYDSQSPCGRGCYLSGCPLAEDRNPEKMFCRDLAWHDLPEVINRLQKWADEHLDEDGNIIKKYDCSKAVDYLKVKNKLCETVNCDYCDLNMTAEGKRLGCSAFEWLYPEEPIIILQKWADENLQEEGRE